MAAEVQGIRLQTFEEPLRYALTTYSDQTDGRVQFNPDEAAKLELTPDKPNSARSVTPVIFNGETIADLYTIAFAPYDATGDFNTYQNDDIDSGVYPAEPKYYPRSKAAARSEAHLALLSQHLESSDGPAVFAGHLSVLGLQGGVIQETGYLGQESHSYIQGLHGSTPTKPLVTRTTGHWGEMESPTANIGERFGDPHAILNGMSRVLQVCAFFAIPQSAPAAHLDALRLLNAKDPQSH